jgi:hypothetical protein
MYFVKESQLHKKLAVLLLLLLLLFFAGSVENKMKEEMKLQVQRTAYTIGKKGAEALVLR